MHMDLLAKINNMMNDQVRRKRFLKVVSCLMAVVVFCTTYALILPGITMEHTTYCGQEEHTHTDDCLPGPTVIQTLICQPEQGVDYVIHSHDENCYDKSGNLLCSLAELTAHTHAEDCYAQVQELICGKAEREEHFHTEDCYITINELICIKEEKEGHSHNEECYVYVPELCCGLAEDENHTHTEDCYTQKAEMICSLPEEEGHSHTDDCYIHSTELICGRTEGQAHNHTQDCYETVDKLKCGQLELIPHLHDDSCYDENGQLNCAQPQVIEHQHSDSCKGEKLINTETVDTETYNLCDPGKGVDFVLHTHDEYCYDDNGELACTLTERVAHTHDESCYDESGELTCTTPEVAEHSHSDDCLADGVLACGLPMVISHQHDKSCINPNYGNEDAKYICGLTEHIHSEECYQKPDGLKFAFSIEDQGISGAVTIDWSEELPDDLTCTVAVLQGYEDDYDQMYAAAADAVETPEGELSDITLYQIDWTSNGESYTLPEGLNPTIDLNVASSDDLGDIEQITGVVIEQLEATEEPVDEEQLAASQAAIEEAMESHKQTPSLQTGSQGLEGSLNDSSVVYATTSAADSSTRAKLMLLSAEDSGDGSDADTGNNGGDDTGDNTGDDDWADNYEYYEPEIDPTGDEGERYTDDDMPVATDPNNSDDENDNDGNVNNYDMPLYVNDTLFGGGDTDSADSSGDLSLGLGSSNVVAVIKTRKYTGSGGIGYYTRVDSLDQITSSGQYLIMSADGQVLVASNSNTSTGSSYLESNFETPLRVTAHQVQDANYNKYYIFSDGAKSYVNYNSSTYKTYHWKFSTYSSAGSTSSGHYYTYNYGSNCYKITNMSTSYDMWLGGDFYSSSYGYRYVNGFELSRSDVNAWRIIGWYNSSGNYKYWLEYYRIGQTLNSSGSYETTYYDPGKITYGWRSDTNEVKAYYDNMLIYKYVGTSIAEMDDEALVGTKENVEVAEVKNPNTYKNDVSGITEKAMTGTDSDNLKQLNSSVVTYASDPATSLIQENFSFLAEEPEKMAETDLMKLQSGNDGRVVTDKTVIYNNDDFDAYSDYDQGDFSVTLSALGQEWTVQDDVDSTVPIDVVFILDLSSSMHNNSYNGKTRWQSSVDALNYIAQEIMDNNSQNRIGMVAFSATAVEVLPIDRYSNSTDTTMPFLSYNSSSSSSYSTLQVSSGLTGETKSPTTTKLYSSNETSAVYGMWSQTFTQRALEQAYNTFSNVTDTTATVKAFDDEGNVVNKTVNRQPVIILLSDGDPTIASFDYMNPTSGTSFGFGNSEPVFGYYTVLSANYFKNMIGIKYNKVADFYTIALGIEDSTDQELYSLAVLNPTDTNIGKITTSSVYVSFKYLLTNTSYKYRYDNFLVYGQYYKIGGIGVPNDWLGARDTMNPYTKYAYADGAYYGEMDAENLKAVFKSILDQVQTTLNYNFLLEYSTSVTFTDEIGDGMTVKGMPVLRYDGVNISDSQRATTVYGYTDDGRPYTEYSWSAKTTRMDNSTGTETELDLSGIKARVYQKYTSTDGTVVYDHETVEFYIPEDLLPRYYPNSTKQFYYEAQPVRLIYKVGISDDELLDIANSTEEIVDKVYYTSQYDPTASSWENMQSTKVTFTPAVTDPSTGKAITSKVTGDVKINPFYTKENLATADTTMEKSSNATDTNRYSFSESISSRNDGYTDVVQYLGNLGKLTINRPKVSTISVEKSWYHEDDTTDSVTVRLYASGTRKRVGTEVSTEGIWCLGEITISASDKAALNWKNSWDLIPRTETIGNYEYEYTNFYVREVSAKENKVDLIGNYNVTYLDKDGGNISTTTLTLTASDQVDSAFKEKYPILDDDATVNVAIANSGYVNVQNAQKYALPHAGGVGMEIYALSGAVLLMFGGASLLIFRRKKED